MKKVFYRVDGGDTLLTVSKKFGVPVCKIIALNNLERQLEEGDLIYIEYDGGERKYTVDAVDTLTSIAIKFGVTEQSILSANGIETIFFGQELVIP